MSELDQYTARPRKRGRPTNAEREARRARGEAALRAQEAQTAPEIYESQEPKRVQETHERRRRRKDDGPTAGLKLAVPEELKEEGFEYRWSNDDGRKIHERTVNDDWDVVRTKEIDGEGEGVPVKRLVGKLPNGEGQWAYLTRKPKDWYDEDKGKQQERIAETEHLIRKGGTPNPGGLSSADHSYIPDRHEGFSSDKDGQNRVG